MTYKYSPETQKTLTENSTKANNATSSTTLNYGVFATDVAQSHHFTVHIDGIYLSRTKSPNENFGEFLPVKSIDFSYTSYENMSIPVAIFGDFPLLNKKRVSTLTLTCYDNDNNDLESDLRVWENTCFPMGRYVAYITDVAKKLTYKGYNVKGKETLEASFYVIPSGRISVSRDYSANDAKMINFGLVCVGDGSTCATGSSNSNFAFTH